MKILFLAPEEFYTERGTPIAVRLALRAISEEFSGCFDVKEPFIHLLTYPCGKEISITGVKVMRCWGSFLCKRGVPPGISVRKIILDIFMLIEAIVLAKKNNYTIVHAVEESVFMALILKKIFGIPYLYDMDSSIVSQLLDRWRFMSFLRPFFSKLERFAIKESNGVLPVCQALKEEADAKGAKYTRMLNDISLLSLNEQEEAKESLREEIGLSENEHIITYVGNLAQYQGIDLLLESFCILSKSVDNAHLVIIGGRQDEIDRYKKKIGLNMRSKIHFLGHRDLRHLGTYLSDSDILVSPRICGNNTPMKIYTYLHVGKPIVATNLQTHTQVLNSDNSILVQPEPRSFASAIEYLLKNPSEAQRLGNNARILAEKEFTYSAFKRKVKEAYQDILGIVVNMRQAS